MESLESKDQSNELKKAAHGVFVSILTNKIKIKQTHIKFYNIKGHDMANIVLDFPCSEDENVPNKCTGCELCIEDRDSFAKEYNILTSAFKAKAIKQFRDTASKSHNKNPQKEMDY